MPSPDYIAKDSRVYVQSVVAKIFDASRRLASQPLIGRIVPEIGVFRNQGAIRLQLSAYLSDRRQ